LFIFILHCYFFVLRSSFLIPKKMFISAFFHVAAVAPARQRTFRYLAAAHLAIIGISVGGMVLAGTLKDPKVLGNALLVTGIVEGALLIGWRLTQLPKSQALEFLLVSPLRPPLVFLGEALVGLVALTLITLAGLPILVYLVSAGVLFPQDLFTLLLLPLVWGAVTGLGLTAWAFEPLQVRRWGERLVMAGVIFYLLIGVVAGENLPRWLSVFPTAISRWFLDSFRALHDYNPFGVMKFAMEQPLWAGPRIVWVVAAGLLVGAGLLARGAWRLHGHFQEEHYRPIFLRDKRPRPQVSEHPLTWWAVKRVTKFGGRINLWLAGGFAVLYAAYTVFHDVWPSWLGTYVFVIMGDMGGIPVLTTALVLLAAVPAAFQYGVWDSNVPDRCRRLELLLITDLDGAAFWHASAGAAWNRGRGYVGPAVLLWTAGLLAGQITLAQVLGGVACGVILWGLYFALGFWAFVKGVQASVLGIGLTLALPLGTCLLARQGWTFWTGLLPPGSVYLSTTTAFTWAYMLGPILGAAATLGVARFSLARCEAQLRCWYEAHHGAGR
jgi:hypothetical protein